ncbi:transcriptional regulator, partial [Nonomuraea fuscirosea]
MSTGSSTVAAAVRAERTRILSELLSDLPELAVVALATMLEEIPAYAAQDAAFRTDVRDQVVKHYRAKLGVLLEERTVTFEDISFTRRAAMRRARAGVALADYINAFRVGQQVFWEAVVERAGHTYAGREAALSLAAPLMRYCDFASTHAANAYMEFQQYAAAEAVRESRDLLETLLAGGLPTRGRELAAAQAHGLGPDARTPLLVVIAVLAGPAAPVPRGPDQGADAL